MSVEAHNLPSIQASQDPAVLHEALLISILLRLQWNKSQNTKKPFKAKPDNPDRGSETSWVVPVTDGSHDKVVSMQQLQLVTDLNDPLKTGKGQFFLKGTC